MCSDKLVDGLYLITPKMYDIYDTELNNISQTYHLKEMFHLIIQRTFGI